MTKFVTLIALLALAMLVIAPASAVWHNGNWYTDEQYEELIDGATVIHNPKTGVDSKYKDTNPAKSAEVYAGKNSCTLEGNVRAGYNTLTKEVLLSNVLAPNESITLPILPDGTFRYDGLAQGDYILKIVPQFEGLGPAQESRVHCEGGVARPMSEMLGYAVSTDAPVVCQREIVSAEYGAFEQVCEQVLVSEEIPAHKEYRYYEWDWSWSYGWHKHYTQWSDSRRSCHDKEEQRMIPMVPAVYKKVCEQVGRYTTVTQNVRDAVATGHLSFLFDNRPATGGIFATDGTTILSEIEDPAKDIVKHVSITYKDCGGFEDTVEAEEYQVISLN